MTHDLVIAGGTVIDPVPRLELGAAQEARDVRERSPCAGADDAEAEPAPARGGRLRRVLGSLTS